MIMAKILEPINNSTLPYHNDLAQIKNYLFNNENLELIDDCSDGSFQNLDNLIAHNI